MNALWWWIDRWRKSTAFMDMTLEQQGAYRNLLDEATLRGGALPADPRILAKASGDAHRWKAIAPVVMKRFFREADGWHNETLDKILQESVRRAKKQRAYRARSVTGHVTGNGNGNKARPPISSLYVPPSSPPKGGTARRRRRRPDVQGGTSCSHHPRCRTTQACIARTLKERQ